jgi:mannose-6-phosphate isomerase-like protein (cupin superfamily)
MLDNQYFKKYLADRKIDLKEHLELDKLCTLDIDPKAFEDFANKHREEARPFLNAETNEQAINANWIGYNEHNTTETNWGLDPKHNSVLKQMIGRDNFERMGLNPDETLLRLLEYMPGHSLPLHYDGFEGFKRLYGKEDSTRFFVAVSDWDWGHVLQVHDNMIANWQPGDTYIIPAGVCHASANFGISPKYTLTVTGVVR